MTTATDGLQVSRETKPRSTVELKVEAPAAELDRAVQAAVRRLGSRLRMPGFRPGKVPAPVVEKAVGWAAIRDEAVSELVPDLYGRVLAQEEIDPVGDPDIKVEVVERGQPVKFTATVTVRPEVSLGDYASIRVPVEKTEIGDKEVEETIDEVRKRFAELREVSRAAVAGDVLRIVLKMSRGDEVLSNAEGEERDLELDSERLLNGLADALAGMKTGDEKSFQLTLPEDYSQEELRGAVVDVEARVVNVRERELPAVGDALAEKDGHGKTVAEMRDWYRERLVEQAETTDREKYEGAVLEKFRDLVKVDIPEAMIERELDRQVATMEMRMASLGIAFERYLELQNSSVARFRAESRDTAVARVQLELALDALAEAEGLDVDESAVERELRAMTEGRKYSAAQRDRLRRAARRDLVRQAAGERAVEIAKGEG